MRGMTRVHSQFSFELTMNQKKCPVSVTDKGVIRRCIGVLCRPIGSYLVTEGGREPVRDRLRTHFFDLTDNFGEFYLND